MDLMFALTIAALFSGVHHTVGHVKVQLSDLSAVATIFLAGLRGFATPRVSPIALLALLTYLLYYVVSAVFVKASLGVIKMTQIILVLGFLFTAFGYYRTHSSDRLIVLASVLILGVLFANIGWHIAHGQYVGWKQLNEPKTAFTVLPLLLLILFTRFDDRWPRFRRLLVALLASIIIFLSGERKAYIFALVALVVWMGPLKLWRFALVGLLAAPLLWAAASSDRSGYLQRQIASFQQIAPGAVTDRASESELLQTHGTTLSNAERLLSNRMAYSLWTKDPIFGIGTGAFALAIDSDLTVPENFRQGIHGEFFRNLYEDGIVGLFLYVAIWLVALAEIALAWRATEAAGNPPWNKLKLLSVIMCLIYVAFEANKGLTLLCICLLPFVVALPSRTLSRHPQRPIGAELRGRNVRFRASS